ncbi:MAG: SpoIIE family protein phosphatase [Candidatus Dormibacteraeota bacterium]|nr:SpoIIE family protein phosphatase [Candidatus Dormibacteraeota bacterium]
MEVTGLTRRVVVRERSDAGEARRQAMKAAESARFDDALTARLSIIAAEMTTNLLKHTAKGGELLINALTPPVGPGGVELLAIDRGPGMTNPAAAMEDRYSTSGSLGVGMGAIRRQSSDFEIHSVPQRGTAVLARVHANGSRPGEGFDVGVVTVAKDGEEVSGDGWALSVVPEGIQVVVVDGLGHGLLASEAAALAIKAYRQSAGRAPVDVLRALHPPLRGTRGATVGVATIDTREKAVTYGGIGNIAASVIGSAGARQLVSLNGTLGREPVQYHQFQSEWEPSATLIMHSDGLMSKWRLDYLPGLAAKDPTLIAAVLFRDFVRNLDDVTVVVVRQGLSPRPSQET